MHQSNTQLKSMLKEAGDEMEKCMAKVQAAIEKFDSVTNLILLLNKMISAKVYVGLSLDKVVGCSDLLILLVSVVKHLLVVCFVMLILYICVINWLIYWYLIIINIGPFAHCH